MQLRRISQTLAAMTLIAMLGACGPVKETRPTIDPDLTRVQQLLAQQDYLAAASLYQGLAARTPGIPGYSYLLDAIDAAIKGRDYNTAETLAAQAGGLPLDEYQLLRLRLQQAELAMARNHADQALQQLLSVALGAQAPRELATRYLRDLADAYRLNGNLLDSANTLQRLDALLDDHAQRLEVQTEILRSLALLNELVLTNLQPSPPGVAGGWMQLALLVKQYGDDPQAIQTHLEAWRARFPDHPALPDLLSDYQARLQSQIQRAAHIAVLLPQSGPLAAASAALRDGMMVSLYRLPPDKRPALRFYDSSDTHNTWPLFSQAVAEGAELIIGPLQKDAVMQLARAGELPIPVLALNQVQTDSIPPVNFFMFALSPEDEARQAADRIWLDGLRQPLLLVPQGEWGERIAGAFDQRWQQLSGMDAEYRTYDPEANDYSPAITSLLHLDRSEARRAEIQRWLGRRVEFEPRRREDVDAFFVAARPRQAQSIRPLLQFHHAGDLPLYATSHAWNGTLNSRELADMKGMILADVPLLVTDTERENLARDLPAINGPLVRLYAMGMDALNLAPHLRRLQSSPYESLDGESGNLFMDPANRILRQTVWLRLGQPPQILGYAARLDLADDALGAPLTEPDTQPGEGETAQPAAPIVIPSSLPAS